jgi:hypothetical protein
MTRDGGLKAIGTALACVEQHREVTTADILQLGHGYDLATHNRREAGNEIPITHFVNSKFLYKFNLYLLLFLLLKYFDLMPYCIFFVI